MTAADAYNKKSTYFDGASGFEGVLGAGGGMGRVGSLIAGQPYSVQDASLRRVGGRVASRAMSDYLPILVMAALVIAFVMVSFIVSQLLAPQRPNSAKQAPYECGIVPEQEPAERFPVKFYLVAMSFIVLDVEIVFLYPFAVVFRGLGAFGLFAVAAFVLVLLVPFAYLLSVGALEWGPVRDVLERLPGPLLRTDAAVYDPNADDARDADDARRGVEAA